MICPKCNIPYSDPKVKNCLLCGAALVASQEIEVVAVSESKAKKVKTPKVQKDNMFVNPNSVQLPMGKTSSICEVVEVSESEFKNGKQQMVNIKQMECVEEVKPFDDKGGFSKRNGKKELEVAQLKADYEAQQKRLAELENFEKYHHPEPKPWYADPTTYIGLICLFAVFYLVYWFVQSQGGMPAVYDFLRRIGL